MISNDQRAFLDDLRRATGRLAQRPKKGELLEQAFEIPLIWPEKEYPPERSMADQFTHALAQWGGKVTRAAKKEEVVAVAAEIIAVAGAKRISRWRTAFLDSMQWEKGLAGLKVEWIQIAPEEVEAAASFEARKAIRDRLATIEVGIIDADAAVAHTGTLLLRHDAERNGFTNLFPWTCIAIVRLSQMSRSVQDLIEGMQSEAAGQWEASTVFVTGPSRSGDIDLAVGQGAAGPGEWHVILIEDQEEQESHE